MDGRHPGTVLKATPPFYMEIYFDQDFI